MANAIELIKKYLSQAVVLTFAQKSKSRVLETDGKRIQLDFAGGNTVKILNLQMEGLSDYKRANNSQITAAGGYSEFGAGDQGGRGYLGSDVGATWEAKTLRYDRGAQLKIDAMDDEELAGQLMGTVVGAYIDQHIIPEVDTLRFATLAAQATTLIGNRKEAAISDNTIISEFNSAIEFMSEAEVDGENQVFFVNPSVMSQIRNTTELQRKLTQVEYKSAVEGVSFTITKYEGRVIEEVPTSRFYTEAVAGVRGFYPSATSKIINFLLVDKSVVLPVVKVDNVRVFTPDQVQDFDGYKINFRVYHDLFVPERLRTGVYAHVSNTLATTKTAKLNVALSAGASGRTKITDYATLPLGHTGSIYGLAGDSGFEVGKGISEYSSAVAITVGTDFTAFSGNKGYFALVNARGVIIAVSTKYTDIPKGASN